MSIHVFVSGIFLFSASICLHIALWRIRYPGNRPLALFSIFFIVPVAAVLLYSLLVHRGLAPYALPLTLNDWLAAFLLHLSLSSAYILTYPAVEALSPSLVIVLLIGENEEGLERRDLAGVLADDVLLTPRISDLIEMKLVNKSGDYLRLTGKGNFLIRFFIIYRRFIGLPAGRG
ncbi:MAG: hypothetical protein BMS9Abin23_1010 [Thermodesulfobacteriota bacterium]|nr:MAG: hypothetical protein BMS9Abin23_1010 [Thermodesulfobacteriota bacterium]